MTSKFLPKTFDSCGVEVSPLGRKATVDTIVFRQPLAVRLEKTFCFWIGETIQVWVYPRNKIWVLEVAVSSLPRFANGRSSSLIRDYHDVLLTLNAAVNLELKNRRQSLCFDAFEAEIIRLDCFVDLRFKNKSEMRQFFENAVKIKVPALPFTTDYPNGRTHCWHNNDSLTTSVKILKLYNKQSRKRKNPSEELNRNKLRLETSLQNFNRQKITTVIAKSIKQLPVSYAVKIESNDARIKNSHRIYKNKYAANCFTLLNQYAIDTAFYHTAKEILLG